MLIIMTSLFAYWHSVPVYACKNDSLQSTKYVRECIAQRTTKDNDKQWAMKVCRESLFLDSGLCTLKDGYHVK